MSSSVPKVLTAGWDVGEKVTLTSPFPSLLRGMQIPCRHHADTHVLPSGTYVFICCLVGADQVCVEAREANDGPDGEEAHHSLQHSGRVKDIDRRRRIPVSPRQAGWQEVKGLKPHRWVLGSVLVSRPVPVSNQNLPPSGQWPSSDLLPPPPPVRGAATALEWLLTLWESLPSSEWEVSPLTFTISDLQPRMDGS